MNYEELEAKIIGLMFNSPLKSGDTITSYHKRIAGNVIRLFAKEFPNGFRNKELK